MAIGSTTVAALRAEFASRIIATTPDHSNLLSEWRRVRSIQDVPGPDRAFYVSIADQRLAPEGEGVYTSAFATYHADLKIWVGYGGMSDEAYEDMRSADARQLWTRLSAAGGATTGLLNIKHTDETWEEGDDSEEGSRWGAHTFEISYLLEQP